MRRNGLVTMAAVAVASFLYISTSQAQETAPPKKAPPKPQVAKPPVPPQKGTHPPPTGVPGQPAGAPQARPAQPVPPVRNPQVTTPQNQRPDPTRRPNDVRPNDVRPNDPRRPEDGKGPGISDRRGAAPRMIESVHAAPVHSKVIPIAGGGHNVLREDGTIHSIHRENIVVTHVMGGPRVVEHVRPNGDKVMLVGKTGYVSHSFPSGRAQMVERTYVSEHGRYAQYYRGYSFHNVALEVYAPRAYYAPLYYGWVYRPWAAPVVFSWGWGGSPWYGYYGSYFTPYGTYASPSQWMTDYLISASLAGAYQQQNPGGPPPPGPPLSPQVKDYINQEVQRQLALSNEEALTQQRGGTIDPGAGSVARLVTDGQRHVFVAHASLDVVDHAGNECPLSEGDAVQFVPPAPGPDAAAVNVQVLWSRGQDCRIGTTISLGLANLQEMQNFMRATTDQALAELNQQQGHNGIPAPPANVNTNTAQAEYAPLAPPPDPNAESALQDGLGAADQVEKAPNAGGLP